MLLLAAALAVQQAAPAPAPTPTATAAPAPVPAGAVMVRMETDAGPVLLAVDVKAAPVTAANFLKYVDGKKLDGIAFYRAVKVGEGYGLVQFGTQNDPKRTLPPIAHEPTTQTGLSHLDGALSMAMASPGTAGGDFFVVVGDLPSMDAKDGQPGFAVFGRVVEGMDTIRRVLAAPTSPTKGEGVMKGQMLEPVVRIRSARRG